MDHYRLLPSQRAYIEMGEKGLICFFALCILSIIPLIDGQAISWKDIGLIFIACLLITILCGVVEFLRPAPQEVGRAVDDVMNRFEKRLNNIQSPASWTSGPYPVLPPAQQQAMYHQTTQKVPAVTFPNNTWQPSNKPTQQMPAITQVPQTSQHILLSPHHF